MICDNDCRQLASPSVSILCMAADGKTLVPLRQKTRKKNQEICGMSRRRISCKDLGLADCQGWLYKKKEKGGFIGNKWKKFWCVLKASSLYWYSSQLAEKAEGFISLPNFTVEQATECKKKHAMKIIHPHIKTFYFAAESTEEMNMWLNKLGLAVSDDQANKKNEEECYSESEHEDPEINAETPPPPYSDQLLSSQSDQREASLTSCVSSEASCYLSSPESTVMKSQGSSSSSSLSKALHSERQSWLDFVNSSSIGEEAGNLSSAASGDFDSTDRLAIDCHETMGSGTAKPEGSFRISLAEGTSSLDSTKDNLSVPGEIASKILSKDRAKSSEDEMEKLYKSLEQASLSPIGDRRPSTKKELRKSFIKRSKNPSVNEKLHKIRALNSTLKCKEHDLAMINQLLEDPKLTARKFREWKTTNTMLVQDIYQQQDVLNMSQENVTESELAMQPSFIESTI
ncbi:interactor protein for cytohesin exchange factors 1 isoform X2 [Sceloporus undulatus]|uniref:interactor protein for cytohesin exchange factors 1 isoform X2 n=1 Tax=Sceloporus undulatus TaxID=8520 RepID=UPI001C4C2D33|nr:interactor protein for cytohesin exchange factors 1 isoform X2 [Sceloporus undulatus]